MDLDSVNKKLEENSNTYRVIEESIKATSAPLQQLGSACQIVGQSVIDTVKSSIVQNVLQLGQVIAKSLSQYDFSSVLKNFSEAIIPLKYINLLRKLNWPLFLIENEELRDRILEACAEKEDADIVRELVFEYCNNDFLDSLDADWSRCPAMKSERNPILSEAILMHKQGFYYASVSILMCQVYGIAADINDLAKANGLILDKDGKEFVAELFDVDIKYIDKEKGRLLQSLILTESGMLLWDAMGDYIKDVTLYSGKDYSHIKNHPLRNKIGHGDQLNFGTKEHSLKAILTIDMMIQLLYEINRVVQINNLEEK